ncbi:STAS/SEC14 domain-containing protein [Aliidiomarina sp. Khilg15.8]
MIEILHSEKENLVALKVRGEFSKEDVHKVHNLIDLATDKSDKVDFYIELDDFLDTELSAMWEGLKVDASHMADYRKVAFVGDKKWHARAAKVSDFLTGADIKYFDVTDKESAKGWVGF